MTSGLEAIQAMENPGLRRHVTDEPFLRIAHRRVASPPPMARPFTDTTESSRAGYPLSDFSDQNSRPGEGFLRRVDPMDAPSPTGRPVTPGPSVDNGSYGADPWIAAHHETGGVPRPGAPRLSGAALTQLPGEVRQKRPATDSGQPLPDVPDVTDQMAREQNRNADQRRIDTQKQVGGGSKENPAYERGQQLVDQRMMTRRLRTGSDHPLFRGAALVDSPVYRAENDPALLGLRHFYDTDYRPDDWGTSTQQPMIQFKSVEPSEGVMDEPYVHPGEPVCETCWLKNDADYVTPRNHHLLSQDDHPFTPFQRHPNERYSAYVERERRHYDSPDLRYFVDTELRPPASPLANYGDQPMMDLKETYNSERPEQILDPGGMRFGDACETCYLKYGTEESPVGAEHNDSDHPFKPFSRQPNERYSHHNPDQDVHDVMDIQGADGNWNYDPYMHGMFNGMELVRSIHDGDEPEFREAPDEWLSKDAAVDDEDDPRAELEGLISGLPEAGSPVAHTRPTRDQMNTLAEMGFGRYGDPDDAPYWFRRDRSRDYLIQPGIEGYWESSSGPHEYWDENSPHFTLPVAHPSFEEAVEHMRVAPRSEPARPGKTREFDPDLRDRVVNPGLTSLNGVRRQANEDDDWYEGSDYPSVDECSNCGSSSVEGVPGRSYCYDCGHTESPRRDFGPLKTRDLTVWDQAHQWGEHGKPGMEEAHPGSGKRILEDVRRGPGDITPLDMQRFNSVRTYRRNPNRSGGA